MPKILEQINSEIKQAMRDKRVEELSTLRMLIAAIRNKEISLRENGKAELTDEQIIEVLASEIKKRKDSVLAYEQGNRQDLALKENNEIKILEKYLPAQLPEAELEKIISEIIAKGETNFGKVMGQAMAKVKGKAEGTKVGEIVKRLLAK